MELTHPLLVTAQALLTSEIAPQAEELDRDAAKLFAAFARLGQHQLLGLRVPRQWGGTEVEDLVFQQFQEMLARYSGALTFLQAQHQSAGFLLAQSTNHPLKQTLLPQVSTGQVGIGVSFSHLRRPVSPLKAVRVEGGYRFTGLAPWVTGWDCFQHFIAAALLPDETVVYAVLPLQTQRSPQLGTLICSPPMALAAFTSTNTVTVEFDQWWVPDEQVVLLKPLQAMPQSDRLNVLQHSFYALGCAQAGLDILQAAEHRRSLAPLSKLRSTLANELAHCRTAIFAAQSRLQAKTSLKTEPEEEAFAGNLALRARAIELASRCAQAAVVVSGGAANNLHHPAQRVFREAMVFSVTGQTQPVMEATLAQLAVRP